ncbi:MAG: ribosomal L7Ae/L30e/S12e/Gadd45 family protein [Acholeplasmatales bacterium]|nr:ribosomal L7Ae/L30e/S12e/Gadd45 family protein [Acholeplasmatales bacterium]
MDKILNNLGLCQRAKGVISGEEMVEEYLKANKVYYIFLANDASKNTQKRVFDKAKYYNVEVDNSYSSDEISAAIGKVGRMVVGITNSGFVKILKK